MPSLIPPAIAHGSIAASPQPVLAAGGGLVLSPLGPADAPALVALFADPAFQEWHGHRIDSEDEAREVAGNWAKRWSAETGVQWKVTRGSGGELVGRIGLLSIAHWDGRGGCFYSTAPAARGQGIAPRALAALCGWAFGTAGFHRIELWHSTANPASCRVAEKSGFAAEGILRGAEPHTDGWHDLHLHARVSSD